MGKIMFKKYSNKKYLAPAAVAVAVLAALVGYEKACPPSLGSYGGHGQEQGRAQEQALQAKLQVQQAKKSAQKPEVRKLIKVDIQPPFAQRFPAYRHSKRVYTQVTPKKRAVRNSGFDDLERFALEAQAGQAKPDTKKAKSEADTARTASSYSNSGYNSNYNNSYNSQAYNQPYNAMSSTSPVSTGTQGVRSHAPQAARSHQVGPQAHPRAHAPVAQRAPAGHGHAHHDAEPRAGAGQSRPSIAEPVEQTEPKPAAKKAEAKKEDKKEKETEREFNPSAAKPKPTRPKKEEHYLPSQEIAEQTQPTLEDILNNHGSLPGSEEEPGELGGQPSFADKFKAGVQSLVELLVTVSMVKNGWDYVKQACDWLESTFGIGKWVRSLVGSGPQPEAAAQVAAQVPGEVQTSALPVEPEARAALQEPVVLPAEAQTAENPNQALSSESNPTKKLSLPPFAPSRRQRSAFA
jgi:hypothetical protein